MNDDFKKQLDDAKLRLDRFEAETEEGELQAHLDYFGECMSIATLKAIHDYYVAKRDAILTQELPLLLGSMNLKKMDFTDGETIKIEEVVSASTVDKGELFTWAESKGYGDAIKETLAFGKGQIDEALLFDLKNKGYEFSRDSKIEPSTLTKIVKEVYYASGELPPHEAVKAKVFERAKLTKK